ncbi:hypothetical protein MMC09_004437 [Bachmanniomyces sp. S44760]|nr:hypothetical protein [Bachmanniomyces sp. S44760]
MVVISSELPFSMLTQSEDPEKAPFIFAHEFFDALPIHAFQSVAPSPSQSSTIRGLKNEPIHISGPSSNPQTSQWRELVVTAVPASSNITTSASAKQSPPKPDFQLSLSKSSTPSSLVLPEASTRYQNLKSTPGATIEISPEARSYAADFARRIGGSPPLPTSSSQKVSSSPVVIKPYPSGAALILDYGPLSTIPNSTLRGIRQHTLVSPFILPGQVDLSVDVDFTALAEAAIEASPGVEVHGPVEQGRWLERMGVKERADALTQGNRSEELKERIRKGVMRLTERGGGGMGKLYKAMAIVPERGGNRRPVGFGGDVVD